MGKKILHISLEQLESLLIDQRAEISKSITANLYWYSFINSFVQSNNSDYKLDLDAAKKELSEAVFKSPLPKDFEVLKKYLSNE